LNEQLNAKDIEIMELRQENMEMKIHFDKKNKMPKKQRYLSKDCVGKKLSLIKNGPISLAHELGSEVDSGLLTT